MDLSKKNSGILPVGIGRGVFSKRIHFFNDMLLYNKKAYTYQNDDL